MDPHNAQAKPDVKYFQRSGLRMPFYQLLYRLFHWILVSPWIGQLRKLNRELTDISFPSHHHTNFNPVVRIAQKYGLLSVLVGSVP